MSQATLEDAFIAMIAAEVSCRPQQVAAAAALFAEGSTVPFVARYRKEATGGLDDEQLEAIAKRRDYFLELAERRDAILESIAEQEKLTPELEAAIRAATTKQELEDLYLPYKPKRRTRAQIAREKGLEPLADQLLEKAAADATALAQAFIDAEKGVEDSAAALAGARDVLAERMAENADHRNHLRATLRNQGGVKVRVLRGKDEDENAQVYKDYFDYEEAARDMPSHRMLAILRGEREGFLLSDLAVDDEAETERLAKSWGVPLETSCGREVAAATADGYKRLLRPSITNEVRNELREKAEAEAIRVFRANLEALLMQSPIGQIPVMGLDPGYRTGCKLALVDGIGRVVETGVIYPVEPKGQVTQATAKVVELARKHKIHAIAIGNGTASRETELFARKAIKEAGLKVIVAIVPETGASVYSASAVARDEFPDMDVALRGAVSIARRLQDPLAELVKIEPRSMGVGQYQHDVDQKALSGELDLAVESTVNRVGVELNTASPSLLRRVSGVTDRLAKAVVQHREANGAFASRRQLLKVKGFGPKTFELAAGFLRLRDGGHPLDRTAVHPERYAVVEQMAQQLGVDTAALVGSKDLVKKIRFESFLSEAEGLGRFTLDDIRDELLRPGRDPRPDFKTPELRDDITSIEDLSPGMDLEGRVSNVTNFGAFVDIGVKRDGLVHLSELSDKWIDDPRTVVQVGQVVRVRVLEVDKARGRIGLSMKTGGGQGGGGRGGQGKGSSGQKAAGKSQGPAKGRGGKQQKQPPKKGPATLQDLAAKFNRKN